MICACLVPARMATGFAAASDVGAGSGCGFAFRALATALAAVVLFGRLAGLISVPGYAMAAPNPTFGIVIAQALEEFDGERGVIKAMIRKM